MQETRHHFRKKLRICLMKIFNFGGKNLKHFSSELGKLTAFDEMENFFFSWPDNKGRSG